MGMTFEQADAIGNPVLRKVVMSRCIECPICELMKKRRLFDFDNMVCADCKKKLTELK